MKHSVLDQDRKITCSEASTTNNLDVITASNTTDTHYADWTSLLIDYNKEVMLRGRMTNREITLKYDNLQKDIENRKSEIYDYISACQNEVGEMMGRVNNHYISNGAVIPNYPANSIVSTNDPAILSNEIQSVMQSIRNSGNNLLMKKPTQTSIWIGMLLIFFYIIPGIIYFAYKQKKKQQDLAMYEALYQDSCKAYALLAKYKTVVDVVTQQNITPLLARKNAEIYHAQRSIMSQGDNLLNRLNDYNGHLQFAAIPWTDQGWQDWAPGSSIIPGMIRIGSFQSQDAKLPIEFPAFIPFQKGKGLFYKTLPENNSLAISSAKSILLRLFLTTQPGKIELTLIDPVQLGGSVNEFLTLTDVDYELINRQVCSSAEQISARLSVLTEQIKTIQQVYLKSDFESIEAYNSSVKTIAEPYRIVFINDFPVNFSSEAIRNLTSIAVKGPKCGIYPIVVAPFPCQHHDAGQIRVIENSSIIIDLTDDHIHIDDPRFDLYTLVPEASPNFNEQVFFKEALLQAAEKSIENKKVEYSYADMLFRAGLSRDRWWQASAADSLETPIGPSGAKQIHNLQLGLRMEHSVLCVGRPGSGKSNLMSVIISALVLKYPPEELQLYLIDLKSGITFKKFTQYRLPHLKVVAIDSDRDFSLAVLKGIESEMEQRGVTFRNLRIESLSDFKRLNGKPLPRILLIIDEFQELFIDMDGINKEATVILERLIRLGRQVGIHVFLGTQSLSNISIPKAILDLVTVRIALQCGDAESRVVLSEDNAAAKLLKKPGEAIYNARGGEPDSNVRFQVAFYRNDDDRYLEEVNRAYADQITSQAIIFDGSEPAYFSKLSPIQNYFQGITTRLIPGCLWLGKPVRIDESTSIALKRGPGSHLSIISSKQRDGIRVMLSALFSLFFSDVDNNSIIYYLSYSDEDSEINRFIPVFNEMFGSHFSCINRRRLNDVLETLCAITDSDQMAGRPPTYFFIDALHRSHDFESDGYTESEEKDRCDRLRHLVRYGADNGVHVVVRSESYARYAEIFGKYAAEIKYRVAGSMDFNNSMQYVMDKHASQINKDNRLLLYSPEADDQQNKYMQFIPYEIPDELFIEQLLSAARTRK